MRGEKMSEIEDGGNAFATKSKDGTFSQGMTRRQWLAGLAMQSIVNTEGPTRNFAKQYAEWSYSIADAMIEYEKNEVKNGKG